MSGLKKVLVISVNKLGSGVKQSTPLQSSILKTDRPITSTVEIDDPIKKAIGVRNRIQTYYEDGVLFKYRELIDINQNVSDFDRIVQYIRFYEDTFNNPDVMLLATVKAVSDNTNTENPAPIIKVDKSIEDVVTHEEVTQFVMQFVRLFDDSVIPEEVLAFSSSKVLEDLYDQVDVVKAILTLIRRNIEIIDFNDANLLDVSKQIIEPVEAIQQAVFSVQSVLSDNYTLNELIENYVQKPLSDLTQSLDLSTLHTSKSISDLVDNVDTLLKSISLGKENLVTYEETHLTSFTKVLADNFLLADTPSKSVSTIVENAFTLSEQINIVSLYVRKFEDIVSFSTTGQAIAQNYTINNTYFAEDYVGQSVTFS